MSIGTSLVLIAAGAILRFALSISWHAATVNWHLIGDVLMAVGAAGLLVSIVWLALASRRPGAAGNSASR
jgi:hypothetical protein